MPALSLILACAQQHTHVHVFNPCPLSQVRLKDVMGSLMHRDQSAAAMRELYVMRK